MSELVAAQRRAAAGGVASSETRPEMTNRFWDGYVVRCAGELSRACGGARRLPIKDLLARASCQNQDLRDYRIFRILPARLRLVGAYPYSSWREFSCGEKRNLGETKS